MQESEKLETPAQETQEGKNVVRQSAAEYLKERIGEEKCTITLQSMKRMERNMQNHGYR